MNMHSALKRDLVPLIGVLASLVFFVLSTALYPGGYDWGNHTISRLFQPSVPNGADNPARPLAVLAVFMFCVSMAFVFKSVSRRGQSRFHKKTIEIAGIGSMVYAFLVITPMHDVLVGIALLFFVTAMLATFHVLYLERHFGMLCAGIVCLAVTLSNAAMYYGDVFFGFLPIVQKISLATWVGWLLALHFAESKGGTRRIDCG
jgi:hypothetical protein